MTPGVNRTGWRSGQGLRSPPLRTFARQQVPALSPSATRPPITPPRAGPHNGLAVITGTRSASMPNGSGPGLGGHEYRGQAEEVQAGDIGDAAPVDYVPVTDYAGDVYPGVVRAVTGRPDHDAGVQAGAVDEPDGAPFRVGHCGPEPDPAARSRRRLLPMMKSGRARSRRPGRDSAVTRIRPSRVSHQNRSLPASRQFSRGACTRGRGDRRAGSAARSRGRRNTGEPAC